MKTILIIRLKMPDECIPLAYKINKKRLERLYSKVMDLVAIMPGKHTFRRNKEHKVYPYLLRTITVDRPNQVRTIDIIYISMRKDFMYLVAIIELYSHFVLNWSVSNYGCPLVQKNRGRSYPSELEVGNS